jgi:diguanylate cyclase (GGDEF)-like protein
MAQRLTEREEELRIANANLDQLTRLDSLSNLTNRRGFDAKLDAEWAASATSNEPLALMMVDVDHFKAFNDRYGHVAGDMCLRTVADALAGSVREATLVARYGGEEFALLFAATTIGCALDIAERLRATVEELSLTHQAAPLGHVTVSIGVAALRARTDESCGVLIEAADAALYGAKRRGRNTVVGHSAVTQFAQIA